MANLKNITELPVVESTDGLNIIVNDNGAAKQIAIDYWDERVKELIETALGVIENGTY